MKTSRVHGKKISLSDLDVYFNFMYIKEVDASKLIDRLKSRSTAKCF